MSLIVEGIVGFATLLAKVKIYLGARKETKRVSEQLDAALSSIGAYESAISDASKASLDLTEYFLRMKITPTISDLRGLIGRTSKLNTELSRIAESLVAFGAECKTIVDLSGFMDRVKVNEPDAFDIINYFADNYDSKTKTLDLSGSLIIMRIYGPRVKRSDEKLVSEYVDELRNRIKEIEDKAFSIQMRAKNLVRTSIPEYRRSLRRLTGAQSMIKIDRSTYSQLRQTAPDWLRGIVEVLDTVQEALARRRG